MQSLTEDKLQEDRTQETLKKTSIIYLLHFKRSHFTTEI